MIRMNGQTKIIVATACCLALVDIGVRLLAPMPNGSNCASCPPLTTGDGVVRARAIELVDADNNVRGLWNTDENGEPALWMYDRNGVKRVELDTIGAMPSLALNDDDGDTNVYVGINGQSSGLSNDSSDSNDSTHFEMSGDGQFSQSSRLGTGDGSLQYRLQGQHIIFAPGVQPAQAEVR